jgi:putative transposase
MKKRFTEEQIIKVLEEGRAGMKVEELCRKHGISQPTYYNWKTKYSDMTVSEAKKMRTLESENSKLKRLVAEQQLDILVLKDIVSKKW